MSDFETDEQLKKSLLNSKNRDALIDEIKNIKQALPHLSNEEIIAIAKENIPDSINMLNNQRQSIKAYPLPNEDVQRNNGETF